MGPSTPETTRRDARYRLRFGAIRSAIRCRGLVAAAALGLLAGVSAGAGPRIVRGTIGPDGIYRPGSWNPLRLELAGGDEPFTGWLNLAYDQDGEHSLRTTRRISLAPRQWRAVTLYVKPDAGLGWSSQTELLDEAGRLVSRSRWDSTRSQWSKRATGIAGWAMPPDGVLVLIVGGLPGGPGALPNTIEPLTPEQPDDSRNPTGYPRAASGPIGIYTARCNPTELPDEVLGYDPVDLLIWTGPTRDALSAEQIDALLTWLCGGGKMIYCPRSPIPSRNDAFSKLLVYPHRFIEAAPAAGPAESMTPVAQRFGYDCPERAARDDRFVAGLKGLGVVVQLRFGVFDRKLSAEARSELWKSLLRSFCGSRHRIAAQPYYYGSESLQAGPVQAARTIVGKVGGFAGAAKPSLGLTLLLCVVLTVVAGPGEYLVLRMIRRPYWTWWVMPLTLAGFCALALILANRLHSGDLQLNVVSVIDHAAGAPTAYRQRFIGLYSPGNQRYELAVPGHRPTFSGLSLEGLTWYFRRGRLKAPVRVFTDRTAAVGVFSVPVATTRFYQSQDVLPAEEVPIRIELDHVDRRGDSVRLTGRIENTGTAALSAAWLVRDDWFAEIGSLAPAQRRDFDVTVKKQAMPKGRPGRFPQRHQLRAWGTRMGPFNMKQVRELAYLNPHRTAMIWPVEGDREWALLGPGSAPCWVLCAVAESFDGVVRLKPEPARVRRTRLYRILVHPSERGATGDD